MPSSRLVVRSCTSFSNPLFRSASSPFCLCTSVERLPHGPQQLDAVPRLGEDAEDLAVVDRVDGGREVVRGGDEDADRLRLQHPGAGEELGARHPGHHVVRGEDLVRPFLEPIQRLRGIEAGGHLVPGGLEGALQRVQDGPLVVDDQESLQFALHAVSRHVHPFEGPVVLA